MGQVKVFSGPERRRRWSEEQRVQILAEAFSPGACVADVARRHDVSTALIYSWRRPCCKTDARDSPRESSGIDGRDAQTCFPSISLDELA